MKKEKTALKGQLTIILKSKDGKVKAIRKVKNLIVNAGLNWLASYIGSETPPNNMGYIAIGTDNTAPTESDIALGSEVGTRIEASKTVDNNKITYTAEFGAGNPSGGASIKESGIFNASTNGTMFSRAIFNEINKGNDDSLIINWEITYQRST